MPETAVKTSQYELVALYKPELEAKIEAPLSKVAKIITDNGGKITAEQDWGRKELAYKIAGETHAVYRIYTLELPTEAPAKISNILNITDEVLRYLLTKVDSKAEATLAEEKSRRASQTTDEKAE